MATTTWCTAERITASVVLATLRRRWSHSALVHRAGSLGVNLNFAECQMRRLVVVDSYVSAARSTALYSNLLASLTIVNDTAVYATRVVTGLAYHYVGTIDAIGTAISTVGEKHTANVLYAANVNLPPVLSSRFTSCVRARVA